jgi:transposase
MKSGPQVVFRYSSSCMRKPYSTGLSDPQWSYIESHIESHMPAPKGHGLPRTPNLREILDALFYVLKSGCQWRSLPHDFPRDGPPSTITSERRELTVLGRGSTELSANACGFV